MAERMDEFKGRLKEGAGSLTGDDVTEAEGRAQRLRGEAERRG